MLHVCALTAAIALLAAVSMITLALTNNLNPLLGIINTLLKQIYCIIKHVHSKVMTAHKHLQIYYH